MLNCLGVVGFLLVIVSGGLVFAAEIESGVSESHPCVARFSSSKILSESPKLDQTFCTGTFVDETTFVTAAHCLKDIFGAIDDTKNLSKSEVTYMALSESRISVEVSSQVGSNAIFTLPEFRTHDQLKSFERKPTVQLVAKDIAVVRLKDAVPGLDGKSCPKLPTAEACKKIRQTKDSSFFAYVYRTKLHSGVNRLAEKSFSPTSDMFKVVTEQIPSTNQYSFFNVRLHSGNKQGESKPVLIRRGDSGFGLLLKENGNDELTLWGVGSSASKSGESSYMVSVCEILQNPEWQRFFNSRSENSTSYELRSGITTPGIK